MRIFPLATTATPTEHAFATYEGRGWDGLTLPPKLDSNTEGGRLPNQSYELPGRHTEHRRKAYELCTVVEVWRAENLRESD